MEELAIKLAETLDISVQAAIDMYPVIRSQYIWYETLSSVMVWSVILGLISMIAVGVTVVIRDDTNKYDWRSEEINEEWVDINKAFKTASLALVIFIVIGIVTSIIAPFLAPDIMIIRSFLG